MANIDDKDVMSEDEKESKLLNALHKTLDLAFDKAQEENALMLKKLIEITQIISSNLKLKGIIKATLKRLNKIIEGEYFAIWLFDETGKKIILKAYLEKNDGLKVNFEDRIEIENTVINEFVDENVLVLSKDTKDYKYFKNLINFMKENIQSILLIPIQGLGNIYGILIVCTHYPMDHRSNEIGYLSIIANQVGLSLENAQLYKSLQNYFYNVVNALVAALEAKDKYTQGHSLRVAQWSKIVARELDLSENEQKKIYIAGLLHDIGKVGVEEYILLKKAPLTSQEIEKIREHPVLGVKILEPANVPKEIIKAVLYHHENYDGSGYPEGISGEKIPVLARIIRVVDSYDAMISDRPYRKAFSKEWAIEELKRCSGKQFDPSIVDIVVRLIKRGIFDNIVIEN
ncbi:HD domain-containing phosphohydrolase [Thermosipho atlanticus]|uniref:HDIG domain-containing protein n=1 Tax=Thermosipho atlanticus DSM 15807 TaxID=1123380 RepID=A0A1M5QSI3_9BACT|nr:HD domain-containing phosphohydrolase [Thermosipho atlanticus]SHH17084.1 HDIG domain-containing protein [Thermosipho atlanticus DSM 15807]